MDKLKKDAQVGGKNIATSTSSQFFEPNTARNSKVSSSDTASGHDDMSLTGGSKWGCDQSPAYLSCTTHVTPMGAFQLKKKYWILPKDIPVIVTQLVRC